MPELPEVEVLRRQVGPVLAGATVASVWADPHRHFADASACAGRRVVRVHRRGKYLLADLDDGRQAVVHLGMTGQLSVAAPGEPDPRHLRVRLVLDTAAGPRELRLADARKFGRFLVVAAGDHTALPTLHRLGPEPDDPALTARRLHSGLQARTAPVKAVLLEQRLVAGVGNWLADECCFEARVAPGRPADAVTPAEAGALLAALRRLIAVAVAAGGTSFSDYVQADGAAGGNAANLVCYGRAGRACVACGSPLARSQVAGRGTTSCPACQR